MPAASATTYSRKMAGPRFKPNPKRPSMIKYNASKSIPIFFVVFMRSIL